MEYSLEDGERLIKAARYSIELFLKSPRFESRIIENHIKQYAEHRGVYILLYHYPTITMRGSSGFSRPVSQLNKLVVEAAIAAATEDPKHVPVSEPELDECVIELYILSDPERVEKRDNRKITKLIKAGKDGVMIQYGFKSGVILPTIAARNGWKQEEMLDNACIEAGLPKDSWKRKEIELHRFTAKVFRESRPHGMVEEIVL